MTTGTLTVERPVEQPLSPAVLAHRARQLPSTTSVLRRIWKDRRLSHYHRLVVAVLAINGPVAGWLVTTGRLGSGAVSTAVLANFALTALVRQQRVINLLFAVATAAPTSWPLRIRWTFGKVYHFGGLHAGGALATTAWFSVAAGMVVRDPEAGRVQVGLTWVILGILLTLLVTAAPAIRAAHHDLFERVHRFGGWAALLLFGVHAALTAAAGNPASWPVAVVATPAVWVFAVVALSVSATWWDLRRVPVTYTKPSDHVAIAHFVHRNTFAGSSTAISRSPLQEWHHFANVHTPGREGFRLTISRAGDWTGRLLDELPSHLWVKGVPTAGVGNIDKLFRKVLWVATGSGIGPCLPHLLAGDTPSRLVWSARDPRSTYGESLVEEILTAAPDAVVWDTATLGKPDLVRLAFGVWGDRSLDGEGFEAVICISNKPTTWAVVEAFERRGIPAYGAIWDS